MGDALFFLAVAAPAFVLAGMVKGVVGLGLPTVAMGLLGAVLPPAEAAALMVVPSLVTNVWQAAAGPALASLLRRLWPLLLGLLAGTCLGAAAGIGLQAAAMQGVATTALGAALAAYAGLALLAPPLAVPTSAARWLSPLVGGITGLVTAATGVFVIPVVPYLQALDLERDALVQALGLSFTVSTVALAATLAQGGAWAAGLAGASLLAVLPALAGLWLGQRLRARLRPAVFRRFFLVGLLALGAWLALRPVP